MAGDYSCPMRNGQQVYAKATNELIEWFGILIITLNEKYQVCDMEMFFNPGDLISPMVKEITSISGSPEN